MEQIKIAAFDVDNTLFDYRNMCVPASTVAALNRLQEKGIRIVIASSRAYSELSEDLICRIHPDYYVGASGQSVQNANGSLLYICFGDGTNDIEMIRWSGVGVAMGNACQSLKYIADKICPASWEDGIAHQLTSMGLA